MVCGEEGSRFQVSPPGGIGSRPVTSMVLWLLVDSIYLGFVGGA